MGYDFKSYGDGVIYANNFIHSPFFSLPKMNINLISVANDLIYSNNFKLPGT